MFGSSPLISYFSLMGFFLLILTKPHFVSPKLTFFVICPEYRNYFTIWIIHTSWYSVLDDVCNWRLLVRWYHWTMTRYHIMWWINVKITLLYYISVFNRTCMVPIEQYWTVCACVISDRSWQMLDFTSKIELGA